MQQPRSILILKPSSLGDVVHALPSVACIKKHWPAAKVTWLVNPEWAPLLRENPYLHDVVEFPRKAFRGISGWTRFPSWTRALKERVQPDLVVDFQGLLRSALIGWRMGCPVWGTSDSREGARFFHSTVVKVPPRKEPMHAVRRMLLLAGGLGCDTSAPLEWPLPAGSEPSCGLPSSYVVLHPYSRGKGKSLAAAEVSEFCKALAPHLVVLVGGGGEVPAEPNLVNLLGRTSLPQLGWVLRRAKFVVSVDSGPAHIAAALTGQLLAIHTWSDPLKVGPWRPDAWVWKDNAVGKMGDFPKGQPCPRGKLGEWVREQVLTH